MGKTNNIGTYTLTTTGGPASNGVYTIVREDGVSVVALRLSAGGTATYKGAAIIGDFGPSIVQSLVAGETTIIPSANEPIDNLVITVTVGTVQVLTNQ